MRSNRHKRASNGTILIEGALGLLMVTFGAILAVALLLNSLVGAAYKTRLALVTNQAAQFAAANSPSQTTAFVKQLMGQVGLAPHSLSVSCRQTSVAGQVGMQVSIANQFPVLGNGTIMPMQLQICDTEFAAFNTNGRNQSGDE